MSQQLETLAQVLKDITANRKALADQTDTQRQQVEVGVAQLAKFDTLIATLQVVVESPNVLEAILTQEAANATVSPTGAPTPADAPAPVASQEPEQAAAASA
jgi:hypothetical protein